MPQPRAAGILGIRGKGAGSGSSRLGPGVTTIREGAQAGSGSMGALILFQGKEWGPSSRHTLGAGIPAACGGADQGRRVAAVALTVVVTMERVVTIV